MAVPRFARARTLPGVIALATVAGLVVRLAYVFGPARNRLLIGDAVYYHGVAQMLRDGEGFIEPFSYLACGAPVESATHPPLFPLVLAVPTWFGIDGDLGHRIVSSLLGVAVVPLVALVALRLAGRRAAMWAAFLAAVNPAFWMNDVNVLSEALLAPLVAGVFLAALAARDSPGWPRAALLGALVGLATLTRAETLLFAPLLVVPVLWRGPEAWRGRTVRIGAAAVATVAVLLPWTAYNLARFDEPVLLSNNLGGTLASANCDRAYFGERIGWWEFDCNPPADIEPCTDEAVRDRQYRRHAFDYIEDHTRDVPRVVAARVARIWSLYRPFQTADLDGAEGRGYWPPRVGLVMFGALALASVAGAVWLRRTRAPSAWLWSALAVVTITAAAFYGSPRFRIPGDIALTLAAAIGITWLTARDVPDDSTAAPDAR